MLRISVNTRKTHPRASRRYVNGTGTCLHAEINAALAYKPGDVLTVVRWSKRGVRTMSLPCVHCRAKLAALGLKRIYYTDWAGNYQTLRLTRERCYQER